MPSGPYRDIDKVVPGGQHGEDDAQVDRYAAGEKIASFALSSYLGFKWLREVKSFHYDDGENTYTGQLVEVKKKSGKRYPYWYAARKDSTGKTHKVFIGKTEDITYALLQDSAKKLAQKIAKTSTEGLNAS